MPLPGWMGGEGGETDRKQVHANSSQSRFYGPRPVDNDAYRASLKEQVEAIRQERQSRKYGNAQPDRRSVPADETVGGMIFEDTTHDRRRIGARQADLREGLERQMAERRVRQEEERRADQEAFLRDRDLLAAWQHEQADREEQDRRDRAELGAFRQHTLLQLEREKREKHERKCAEEREESSKYTGVIERMPSSKGPDAVRTSIPISRAKAIHELDSDEGQALEKKKRQQEEMREALRQQVLLKQQVADERKRSELEYASTIQHQIASADSQDREKRQKASEQNAIYKRYLDEQIEAKRTQSASNNSNQRSFLRSAMNVIDGQDKPVHVSSTRPW